MPQTLAAIVRARGGDLFAGGTRALIPGPHHSPADRSISLRLTADGRVLIHSFGATTWRDVKVSLQRDGHLAADSRLTSAHHAAPARAQSWPTALSDHQRIETAQRIWTEGRPIRRTLAEAHLRLRGFTETYREDALRFGDVHLSTYSARGPKHPALLAAYTDKAGCISAVEITFLAPNGSRAPAGQVGLSRKTIGRIAPDAWIRLFPPNADRMIVAEGVFSALGARQALSLPAQAMGSASRLVRYTPDPGCEIAVAADRGTGGQAAADALVQRLRSEGVRAGIVLPPPPFEDFGEVMKAARDRH